MLKCSIRLHFVVVLYIRTAYYTCHIRNARVVYYNESYNKYELYVYNVIQ